jgi:hypothetical protein
MTRETRARANILLEQARGCLRKHPYLYDLGVRIRRVFGIRTSIYNVLNEFSRFHNRKIQFVQIGASDGLHSDPIREFVVRDAWSGVFMEPLPYSFARLKKNYNYLRIRSDGL